MLLNTLPVAVLLTAAAFALTRGSRSPATRHAIWTAALVLTPVLSIAVWSAAKEVPFSFESAPYAPEGPLAPLLMKAAAGVAGLQLLRILMAHHRLKALKRGSSSLVRRIEGHRRIDVRLSDAVAAPLMAGCGRAVILVPRALELGEADLDRVLAHEIAHAERYDDVTRLGQQLVKAICWFNPFVYLISRRMDMECELACDAAAARATGGAEAYAAALARLVLAATEPNALATTAVSHTLSVTKRVRMLLDRPLTPPFSGIRFAGAIAVSLAVVAMASPLLAHRVRYTRAPQPGNLVEAPAVEEGVEHYGRGLSLYWGGHYEDAVEEFRKAQALGYDSSISLAAAEAAAR
jgi:Zn-dependent protease with chaperone function